MNKPKIFISYAWDTEQHQDWVIELATRLVHDGIDVILDCWDLKPGQDKYHFMEQMVNDESVTSVIMICDHKYKEKADSRKGGVGTESQIISKEIYENTDQNKFIPVVKELNDASQPFLPAYLKSRIYIDLSDQDKYEEKFEELIRHVYGKPLKQKPELGTPPSYLLAETSITTKTSSVLKKIKSSIDNDKKNLEGLLVDFFEIAGDEIAASKIELGNGRPCSEGALLIKAEIDRLKPIRDDILNLVEYHYKYTIAPNNDAYHDFFENIASSTGKNLEKEAARYLVYDTFLNLITLLIRLGKYDAVANLLYNPYFCKDRRGNFIPNSFPILNRDTEILYNVDDAIPGKLIFQHLRHSLKGEEIAEVDLLLFYISIIYPDKDAVWFPHTWYVKRTSAISIIERMKSKKYFEKGLSLFNIKRGDELGRLVELAQQHQDNINQKNPFYDSLPEITQIIKTDEMCKIP